jgi:phage gp36-like protein
MSLYTNQAAVNGEIPTSDLIALLDDDDNPQPGSLNATLLNQVIANSSGEIDQACANIYGQQLPFNPVPLSVANMALTITCYRLFRRRETPDEKNKWFEQYRRVRDFLDEVNTGDKHLDDVPTRDFPQGALTGQSIIYGGGVFGTGCLSNTM